MTMTRPKAVAWVLLLAVFVSAVQVSQTGARRRSFIVGGAAVALLGHQDSAHGAEAKRWISGKNPDGPSKDNKGTKRDFKYLQCLSNCLSVCEKPAIGKAEKDRSTCLNECRDECCFTYEQCTYAIK